MTPYALNAAKAAEEMTPDQAARSWDAQHAMYQTLGALHQQYDVILCPTLAIGCPPADHDPTKPGFTVDGVLVDGEFGWDLTHHFNMMHNCPVMSVPSGRDRHGVPTGLQIVGRTFDDLTVFRAAKLYETQAPDQFIPAVGLPGCGA